MIRADGMAPGDPTEAPTPEPVAAKITICHWSNDGHWNQIEVSESALNGHDNHQFDIWPPVDGVTDGQNWGRGENVYENGCQTTDRPTPTPTATPTATPSVSVTPSPSVTSTESASPSVTAQPSPTVTVTATATATGTPIPPTPEVCPSPVNEAAILFPMVGLVMVTAMWQRFRRSR